MPRSEPIEVILHSRGGQRVTVYSRLDAEFLRSADDFILRAEAISRHERRKKSWLYRLRQRLRPGRP